jgi:S1-C subfamily serine protease
MTTLKYIFYLAILAGILFSCSSSQQTSNNPQQASTTTVTEPEFTNHYTSSFPQKDVTEKLKAAQQSVIRIVSTAFYNNYAFGQQYITLDDIKTNDPEKISTDHFSSEESTAGTSIILDQNSNNSLLLTCEHTVSFPDTVVNYYDSEEVPPQTYVESISIKTKQNNLVFFEQNLEPYEIIAANKRLDLALLNIEYGRNRNLDQHKLMTKPGNSDLLKLGSFLYIMGFPKGYPMITRGLASSSESWNDRFFITDATFNPGISGGLILASKNNYDSFEWVGIASSASATRKSVLVPRPISDKYSRAVRPYNDAVFVQRQTSINYRSAQAVPIYKVEEFLRDNEGVISRLQFTLEPKLVAQN